MSLLIYFSFGGADKRQSIQNCINFSLPPRGVYRRNFLSASSVSPPPSRLCLWFLRSRSLYFYKPFPPSI